MRVAGGWMTLTNVAEGACTDLVQALEVADRATLAQLCSRRGRKEERGADVAWMPDLDPRT